MSDRRRPIEERGFVKREFAAWIAVCAMAGVIGTASATERWAAEAVLRTEASRLAPLISDSYLPHMAVRTALLELTGTADDVVQGFTELGAGIVGLPGCRVHSCTEKGFVLIDMPTKKLLAFGLRHFRCRYKPGYDLPATLDRATRKRHVMCDPGDDATLAIYVVAPNTGTLSDEVVRDRVEKVREWAQAFPYKNEEVGMLRYRRR